ncbi:hypothetical protein XENORESO_005435 [Xenotaenia resolanae]|uniref:Uncharacterized protein n=1 Tax=Xenotaenia resolanae TaxID=208358 RepID=A0ABV0VKV7_9TELE
MLSEGLLCFFFTSFPLSFVNVDQIKFVLNVYGCPSPAAIGQDGLVWYTLEGRKSITRQQNHACRLTTKDNLESPINLTVMVLDCGRKPEYQERTHTCMGRTCKLPKIFLTP